MAQESRSMKKPGTYDLVDLIFFGGLALLFDVGSIIPGVGALGILAFRMIFYFKNVDTKLINLLTSGGGLVELIPAISIFPSVTLFVVIVYVEVKFMESVRRKNPQAAAMIEKATSMKGGSSGTAVVGAGQSSVSSTTEASSGASGQSGQTLGTQPGSTSESVTPSTAQSGGRTLPDGSQPAGGSPLAGGEAGGEGSAAGTSGTMGGRDLAPGEQEQQIDTANKASESEAKTVDSGKGGRFPDEDPVITSPASAQMPSQEKNNVVKGRSEKRVETSRRPEKAKKPEPQESL